MTTTETATITIDPFHSGPPGMGHGGVSAGRFAELADPGRATVRLHSPVPLGQPLVPRRTAEGTVVVHAGDVAVATVRRDSPVRPDVALPVPTVAQVEAAEAAFDAEFRARHPFPSCFACGPDRGPAEGLHLQPSPIEGLDVHGATWRPGFDGPVPAWLVWAAMDCGTAGPAFACLTDGLGLVTGELAVEILDEVSGDATLVITSRAVAQEGRRTHIVASLVDGRTGRQVAVGSSIWFTVAAGLVA